MTTTPSPTKEAPKTRFSTSQGVGEGNDRNPMEVMRYQEKMQFQVEMQQRALAVCQETLGSEHPYTAMEAGRLATLYAEQGLSEDARLLARDAVRICAQELRKAAGGNAAEAVQILDSLNIGSPESVACFHENQTQLLDDTHKAIRSHHVILAQTVGYVRDTMALLGKQSMLQTL